MRVISWLSAVVVLWPALGFAQGSPPDIVISGSRHVVLTNQTVSFASNVIIQDDAIVEINGGTLNFLQGRVQEFSWTVKGNARLLLSGVRLNFVNNRYLNFSYRDHAFVSFTNVTSNGPFWPWQELWDAAQVVVNNSSVGLTTTAESTGSVAVTNSSSVWFELGLPPGTYDGSAPSGFVSRLSLNLGYQLSVTNSTIRRLDIDLLPGVNLTLRNTNSIGLGWVFSALHAPPITIDGLKAQHYDDRTFVGDRSTLRLVNTTLAGWWPTTFNDFILNVTNATLVDPRSYQTSRMNISDSTLSMFFAYGNAEATIVNSRITDSLNAFGNGLIRLTRVVLSGQMNTTGTGRIVRDGVTVAP
jgi:hypothetical protein